MKITDGVYMLEIPANVLGTKNIINPTLIWDGNTAVLVDAGFPGQLQQIREAIESEGIPFSKIGKIILTHQDIDHIGSAAAIARELQGTCEVLACEAERAYIDGTRKPVKIAQLEENLEYLDEKMKFLYERMKEGFRLSIVHVDKTLTDGEVLPYCGGITVIHTPGHTPGHICLYVKTHKILIAGDVFVVNEGQLFPSKLSTNLDPVASLKSMEKLMEYDIEQVICYHGGLYRGKVNIRIEELISSIKTHG